MIVEMFKLSFKLFDDLTILQKIFVILGILCYVSYLAYIKLYKEYKNNSDKITNNIQSLAKQMDSFSQIGGIIDTHIEKKVDSKISVLNEKVDNLEEKVDNLQEKVDNQNLFFIKNNKINHKK